MIMKQQNEKILEFSNQIPYQPRIEIDIQSKGRNLAKISEYNSGQLEQNNVKTDFINRKNETQIHVFDVKKLSFKVAFKKNQDIVPIDSNDRELTWGRIMETDKIKEEELHYLKKKSWVVHDFISSHSKELGLEYEKGSIEWAKLNEKDFMLLNPIGTLEECSFSYQGIWLGKWMLKNVKEDEPSGELKQDLMDFFDFFSAAWTEPNAQNNQRLHKIILKIKSYLL